MVGIDHIRTIADKIRDIYKEVKIAEICFNTFLLPSFFAATCRGDYVGNAVLD